MAEHQSHLISHISNANRESMMMEKSIPVNQVADVKFFITERKAKIAMTCQIKFPSNVFVSSAVIGNKVIIRSDLAAVRIEAYSILCDHVILRPPLDKQRKYTSMTIGRYTIVGENTMLKASVIGNGVRIGRNCILEDNVNVQSYSIILDGSIVPEGTVIPKYCVFGGKPARFIKRIPETIFNDHVKEAIKYYNSIDVTKNS